LIFNKLIWSDKNSTGFHSPGRQSLVSKPVHFNRSVDKNQFGIRINFL
jgi:hypothetical protein